MAFGHGYYEYDDQGNLIKSTEVYDMQTNVASYFYGDNGTLAKKVNYTYPVGSMHENPALNFEVGSDYVSRSLKYELNGNTVSIGDDSGYYTELKLVYPTDNIAWDQGVGHDFTELPNSQGFLYEVGFVETDLPENAMYLIPTAPVITP